MKYLPFALGILSLNLFSADLLEYNLSAKVSQDFVQIILGDKDSWKNELSESPNFSSDRVAQAECRVSMLRPVFGESVAFESNNISY